MSSRRQARAGVVRAAERRSGLPAALTDRHDPLWTDPKAVQALADTYRLHPHDRRYPSLAAAPWWARFDALRDAWCKDNGLMSDRWPNTIDWRRAREAGIDLSSSSRYRLRPP